MQVNTTRKELVLTREHHRILETLAGRGALRASMFDEKHLDDLFKHRPRYVQLVRVQFTDEAVVDITAEGLQIYVEAVKGVNGHARAAR